VRHSYNTSIRKPEGKRLFGRMTNLKILVHLKEIGFEDVDWLR
jgi:hypothetical protein